MPPLFSCNESRATVVRLKRATPEIESPRKAGAFARVTDQTVPVTVSTVTPGVVAMLPVVGSWV